MITFAMPDVPPQCSLEQFRATRDSDENVWTFGGLLLQPTLENDIQDVKLRRVIAKCMGKCFLNY